MAREVVRSFIRANDETSYGTTKVTLFGYQSVTASPREVREVPTYEADVHGNSDATLDRSTNVVAVPSYTLGNIGVNARGD